MMLPCYAETPIQLEELEVEWKRSDSQRLVHLFQDGESRPESQDQAYSGRASFFTEEIFHGNFSLLLTNLTVEDTGVYNCSVYRQHETGQTSVEIKEIGEYNCILNLPQYLVLCAAALYQHSNNEEIEEFSPKLLLNTKSFHIFL